MYKVVTAMRTAKLDAPSMEDAAAQFLKISVTQLCLQFWGSADPRFSMVKHHPKAMKVAVYCVATKGLEETDERVAVFEVKEELENA